LLLGIIEIEQSGQNMTTWYNLCWASLLLLVTSVTHALDATV